MPMTDQHQVLRTQWRERLKAAHWYPWHQGTFDDTWVIDGSRQLDLFWPFSDVPFMVRFSFRSHDPKQLADITVYEDPENSYQLHLIIQGGKN